MSTTTTDWFQQFYQPNPTAPPPSTATLSGRPADATVASNTINTSTTTNHSLAQLGLGGLGSGSDPTTVTTTTTTTVMGRLSPVQEGRVSRPARRRSRASRRNPTTLLNTDTTNFRAMVQRYTGGASAYTPFDSPAGFTLPGGLQPGPVYNFSQTGSFIPGAHYLSSASSAAIDPQASHVHQQLLQQYGAINASSAASRAVGHRVLGLGVEEEGVSSLSHVGSRAADHYSASIGGGENRRSGFMF